MSKKKAILIVLLFLGCLWANREGLTRLFTNRSEVPTDTLEFADPDPGNTLSGLTNPSRADPQERSDNLEETEGSKSEDAPAATRKNELQEEDALLARLVRTLGKRSSDEKHVPRHDPFAAPREQHRDDVQQRRLQAERAARLEHQARIDAERKKAVAQEKARRQMALAKLTSMQVSAILRIDGRAAALVDGQLYRTGEELDIPGAVIAAIARRSLRVRFQGKTVELKLRSAADRASKSETQHTKPAPRSSPPAEGAPGNETSQPDTSPPPESEIHEEHSP